MIEEYILQYGVLGLWTLTLLIDRKSFQQSVKKAITNNTIALNKVSMVIQKCKK